MIYFTSDSHFSHANILKYCNRPFTDVHHMNTVLTNNWNSIIDQNDTVYFLGDFAMSNYPEKYFDRLNGKKHLVVGNHDKKNTVNLPWESKSDLLKINVDGQIIVLCHYSMRVWDRSHHGSWHLFGHSHGKLPPYGLSFDVGVDANNYSPISFNEVKTKIKNLKKALDIDTALR